MRFMMIVKATKDTEASVMPEEKLIAEMATYHEELHKAGVEKGNQEKTVWTVDNRPSGRYFCGHG